LLLIAGAARLLRMGFFDSVSRGNPGQPYPKGDPWDPPSVEFPHVAASAVLLARTEVVAVAITAIWAFTAGFEFWVHAQFRHDGHALQRQPEDQSLRIGVQFADGRKVANVGRVPERAGSVPAGLILSPHSFGAGRRHQDRSYWVWPLPPAGPLSFVCEWAAFGIPESRAEVDARLVLDAARHSVQIWPAGNSSSG
jgi:hypothetical protein